MRKITYTRSRVGYSYFLLEDMTHYLYGRSPICWDELGDHGLLGPELVQVTTEKNRTIKKRMKVAQSR